MPSYIFTCRYCGTANRIPADMESGLCDGCQKNLRPMYRKPQPLDEHAFDSFVKSYGGPVLLEFWAPSCSHCGIFEATVHEVAEMLAGKAAVVQVNIQENSGLAGRFDVQAIPTLFLLKQGRIFNKLSGAQSSETVVAWFQRHR